MATIHVDTELLRRLGSVFIQCNEQVNQFEGQIQNTVSQVQGDWQGVSRQRFEQIFQEWRTATTRIVTQGEDIGRHLQNTAQLFDNIDTQDAGGSTGMSGTPQPTGGSSGTSGNPQPTSGSSGTSGNPQPTSGSTGTSGNPQPTGGSTGTSGTPQPTGGSTGTSGTSQPTGGSTGTSGTQQDTSQHFTSP